MDPTGFAASIITLIEVVQKATKYLNEVRAASSDRRELIIECAVLSTWLWNLKSTLEEHEDDTAWRSAESRLAQPLQQVMNALEDLARKLVIHRAKIVSSLTWPLEKKSVKEYQGKIERLKSLIMLVLQEDSMSTLDQIKKTTDQLPQLRAHTAKIEAGVMDLQIGAHGEQFRNILTWLSPLNFLPMQQDFSAKRAPNSGQWFLNDPTFQTWLNVDGETLWCPGIPGAGKTMLVATVTKFLQEFVECDQAVKVACAYCNYRDERSQVLQNVIAALWMQLVSRQRAHSDDVLKLYEKHMTSQTRPDEAEVLSVFTNAVKSFSKVYLVIDALDELPEGSLEDLLLYLSSLQPTVNLLITSRNISRIAELLQDWPKREIGATSDDITAFIESKIGSHSRLRQMTQKEPKLQKEITEVVIKKSGKMFLLAKLYLDNLLTQRTPKLLRAALNTLPKDLESSYEDAIRRIEGTVDAEVALKILYWIAAAERPLSTAELLHALAVDPGDNDFDQENLLYDDVTSICAGLIEVEESTKTVRLAHYTLRNYLEECQIDRFMEGIRTLATACISYLCFDPLVREFTNPVMKVSQFELYPLFSYAALHWGDHVRKLSLIDGELTDLTLKFLRKPFRLSDTLIYTAIFEAAEIVRHRLIETGNLQKLEKVQVSIGSRSQHTRNPSGLHLAVFFDLPFAVEALLQDGLDPNIVDKDDKSTPLGWAAKLSRLEIARILIRHGADVNMASHHWRPLHHSCRNGSPEMVQILIDAGANLDGRADIGQKGQTPLHESAAHNRVDVTEVLLDRGASINAGLSESFDTFSTDTPLVWALLYGRLRTATLLVNRGAALSGKHLLPLAIQIRSVDLLQMLRARGFDMQQRFGDQRLHNQDFADKNAMDYALQLQDLDLIQFFLDIGVRPVLPWTQDAEEIENCRGQPWYSELLHALPSRREDLLVDSSSAGLQQNDDPSRFVITRLREDYVEYVKDNCWDNRRPYLEVLLPQGEKPMSVYRIIFTTSSHDQGWSDYKEDHGTYRNSHTYFDVEIWDSPLVTPGESRRIVRCNIHASAKWKEHIILWDLDSTSESTKTWLGWLVAGSRIVVFPRAVYAGWINHVRKVKVDVYVTEDNNVKS